MVVGGEAKRARCGMILNNTAWKFTGGGCPVARVTDDAPMSHIAGTFTPTFSLTGARQ